MYTTQFFLLKTRRFLPLFITQLLGAFNDNAFKSALLILIAFKLANDSARAQLLINLASGIFILPFFLFSATAGQLADKLKRTTLIRWIKFSEVVFMLLGGLGFYLENIFLLMSTVFCMGLHSTFFGPIKYSALPDLVKSNELLAANGLIEGSTFLAILAGSIIGTEFAITHAGSLVIAGVCIAVAVIGLLASLAIPQISINNPALKIDFNFSTATIHQLRYIHKNGSLFFIIMLIAWFWLMGFMFLTQFPVFVKKTLLGNEHLVTLFLITFSVGIAIGSLVCNRILKNAIKTKYVPLGMLGMTLFTLDFCVASSGYQPIAFKYGHEISKFLSTFSGWRITLDLLLLSVAGGFYTVPLYTILQTQSDKAYRSRVIACNNIYSALFMVIAALGAMAFLALGFSIIQLFLSMAIINAGLALNAWRKLRSHSLLT